MKQGANTTKSLRLAGSFKSRVVGLLGSAPTNNLMLLMPCCDVHTFGMKQAIDVAFVGSDGLVLKAYEHVMPYRRLKCRGAVAALERFSSCSGSWFSSGQKIGISLYGGDCK